MDKQFVSKMKDRLEDMRVDILRLLALEDEELAEIIESDEVRDSVDAASADIDSKIIAAIGRQDLKRLKQIESALGRISNGTYGRCLKSGKIIPQERLEAMPYAMYTVEVQNEIDRRRRRGA